MSQNPVTLAALLNDHLASNSVWEDFIEAKNSIRETNVDGPVKQLENIRKLTQSSEAFLLNYTARMLGFDLSQDVLNMSGNALIKLVSQLPLYPDRNSTEDFIKFLDLLLNAAATIKYLYTRDYVNFYDAPGGSLLDEGGEWFKTTHVEIDIALLQQGLVLQQGQSVYQRTKELFYEFAPIALVIDKLNFVIEFRDIDWLGGSAFGIGIRLQQPSVEIVLE